MLVLGIHLWTKDLIVSWLRFMQGAFSGGQYDRTGVVGVQAAPRVRLLFRTQVVNNSIVILVVVYVRKTFPGRQKRGGDCREAG